MVSILNIVTTCAAINGAIQVLEFDIYGFKFNSAEFFMVHTMDPDAVN